MCIDRLVIAALVLLTRISRGRTRCVRRWSYNFQVKCARLHPLHQPLDVERAGDRREDMRLVGIANGMEERLEKARREEAEETV